MSRGEVNESVEDRRSGGSKTGGTEDVKNGRAEEGRM